MSRQIDTGVAYIADMGQGRTAFVHVGEYMLTVEMRLNGDVGNREMVWRKDFPEFWTDKGPSIWQRLRWLLADHDEHRIYFRTVL